MDRLILIVEDSDEDYEPVLRAIPVSVMTSSSNPADVKFCYDNGANSMFLKLLQFGTFQQKLSHTLEYWLSTVVLP